MALSSILGDSELLKYLHSQNYYFTLNPDSDFVPLAVVSVKDNTPQVLGNITQFIKNPKETLPVVKCNEEKATLQGTGGDNDDASVKVGTSDLLTKALKFLFGLNVDVSYKGIDALSIKFKKVYSDSIPLAGLTDYLDGATATSKELTAGLCGKGKSCMIIYDTLKSNDISIAFKNKEKAATKNNVKVLLDSAGVSGSGEFSQNNDGSVSYKGEKSLTFALKGIGFYLEPSESGVTRLNIASSGGESVQVKPSRTIRSPDSPNKQQGRNRTDPVFLPTKKSQSGEFSLRDYSFTEDKNIETFSVKTNRQLMFSPDQFL